MKSAGYEKALKAALQHKCGTPDAISSAANEIKMRAFSRGCGE
jgi:hypothetical protein